MSLISAWLREGACSKQSQNPLDADAAGRMLKVGGAAPPPLGTLCSNCLACSWVETARPVLATAAARHHAALPRAGGKLATNRLRLSAVISDLLPTLTNVNFPHATSA
jgi:hypothetical protein